MLEKNHLLNEIVSLQANRELELEVKVKPISSPVIGAGSRRIFVADTGPFKTLPQDVRDATIEELHRLFSFVKSVQPSKGMTVLLLEPSRYPEAFSFTDAVATVVSSPAMFNAYLRDALFIQGKNAAIAFSQMKPPVTYSNPFSSSSFKPTSLETLGSATQSKQIFAQGNRRFALPYMASVVALDEAMTLFTEFVESTIHVKKVRQRRSSLDARYWGSAKALEETAKLSVLDNPKDPSKWLWRRKLLGVALGRMMAHEVRHLYIGSQHAADGLGRDSGDMLASTNSSDFSAADKKVILNAINAWEKKQGKATVVPTFPTALRADFPF